MSRRDDAGLPLAIVGMACRFPGADNLDDRHLVFVFWLLGEDGSVLAHCDGCRFVGLGTPPKGAAATRDSEIRENR